MTDTWQWERCDAAGGSCADLPGETGQTRVSSGDIGNMVRLRAWRDGVLVGESQPYGPITATPTTPAGGWGAGIGAVRFGGTLATTSHLNDYEAVVGDWEDGPTLAPLTGRTYIYAQGSGVRSDRMTGVSYADAQANGWLLGTTSSYNDYAAKIGDDGYIAKFIANVHAQLVASPGVDGVFIDNCSYDLGVLYGFSATYPNVATYNAAQLKFLSAVGTALKGYGHQVMMNADAYIPGNSGSDDGSLWQSWWAAVGPHATDLLMEYWQETSNGSNKLRTLGANWDQHWDGWQRLPGWAHAAGCRFVGTTYGPLSAAVYARASMMLEAGPGDVFLWGTGAADPWNTAWTAAAGAAVGGAGANPRTFASKTAAVNASAGTATIT